MNKGLVDLAKLRKNKDNAIYEGKSSFGFRIGDIFVKIYARENDGLGHCPPDPMKITDFSGFHADTIVFPREYILEKGKKAGEIADFISDKRLDIAMKEDVIVIESMTDNYDKVIQDLYMFDEINMVDLCNVNILYSDSNGFHIIDTTDWYFHKNSLSKNVYYFNSSIVRTLLDYLSVPYIGNCSYKPKYDEFIKKISKYGDAGKRLITSIELANNNKYNFLKLIFACQDVYRIHNGMDANTLSDVKEFTKVLKKG